MFGGRFFGQRFYGGRYFGHSGAGAPVVVDTTQGGFGKLKLPNFKREPFSAPRIEPPVEREVESHVRLFLSIRSQVAISTKRARIAEQDRADFHLIHVLLSTEDAAAIEQRWRPVMDLMDERIRRALRS